jgi:hypothetical protein
VITANGAVIGAKTGAVWSWKGIPYAQAPVGDLRWQPPKPLGCFDADLSAAAFGPACPQPDEGGVVFGDEDCLTLNVWAPEGASNAPVLFFVHGGGNLQGSPSEPLYDGANLAASTNKVVVTIQYRLGALGFFTHPGLDGESEHLVSGNYGILDQQAALRWVKDNIAGFGGAPDACCSLVNRRVPKTRSCTWLRLFPRACSRRRSSRAAASTEPLLQTPKRPCNRWSHRFPVTAQPMSLPVCAPSRPPRWRRCPRLWDRSKAKVSAILR